ncbi:hypothetical protein ACIOHS_12625 [Streptomyces sp. NPDC088253]
MDSKWVRLPTNTRRIVARLAAYTALEISIPGRRAVPGVSRW